MWEQMRLWRDSIKSEGSGVAICGHALAVPLMGAPPESNIRTGPVIRTCSSVAALFAVATETGMSFVGWYRGFALSSECGQSSLPLLLDMGQAEHRWDLFPGWHCPFPPLFRDSFQVGSKPYLASVILELLWPLEKKMSGWEEKGLNFQKHEPLLGKGSEETAHLHTRKWPQGSPFAEPHLNLEPFYSGPFARMTSSN